MQGRNQSPSSLRQATPLKYFSLKLCIQSLGSPLVCHYLACCTQPDLSASWRKLERVHFTTVSWAGAWQAPNTTGGANTHKTPSATQSFVASHCRSMIRVLFPCPASSTSTTNNIGNTGTHGTLCTKEGHSHRQPGKMEQRVLLWPMKTKPSHSVTF